MFTGIIQGQGLIVACARRGREMRLDIRALCELPRLEIGESVAVNGVCLTVEQAADNRFTAYASAETMGRTNLGALRPDGRVNLERALALGDRLGGHMVSGHVDGQGRVAAVSAAGESHCVRISHDSALSPEIIAKGSIALDGVSLTVNSRGPDFFEVNVIPETWRITTLNLWRVGSGINIETDMIGKYVRHLLKPYGVSGPSGSGRPDGVTSDLLRENGFL
jgi:riboflavin synthase